MDLWPDSFDVLPRRTPLSILHEQASALGTKTQNIVKAEVVNSTSVLTLKKEESFRYIFYLVAPAIQNYRFKLLEVRHDIELYPAQIIIDATLKKELLSEGKIIPSKEVDDDTIARIISSEKNLNLNCTTEKTFIHNLQQIFQSKRTTTVISSMLSLSGLGVG